MDNKNRAQNKKYLFCMLYFIDVFYNMKCLRNTYFVCNILLNMKQMLVFIFIKKILVLSFGPPDMNSGSVSELNWLKCDIFSLIQTTTVLDALIKSKYAPQQLDFASDRCYHAKCLFLSRWYLYIYIYIYIHTHRFCSYMIIICIENVDHCATPTFIRRCAII